MEVTKWLKPSISVSQIGDSASVQAATRVSAPGETGKEYVVKVHCDEGVAIHVAPDPCAGVREDVGEASVGERIGQPLSRETVINPSADVVHLTEGKIGRRDIASAHRARRGRDPGCTGRSLCGNREISGSAISLPGRWSVAGRRGAVAADARSREV